jgi:hypothetical protein
MVAAPLGENIENMSLDAPPSPLLEHQSRSAFASSSGNRATLMAIRRASSFVSTREQDREDRSERHVPRKRDLEPPASQIAMAGHGVISVAT